MVALLVLGLQGSPKKNGSSDYLLKTFLKTVEKRAVEVRILDISRMNIRPCIGCGYCEKNGFCVMDDDDMAKTVYAELRNAEVIVAASPVFFYSVTAQLKALIDRTQALWSRKYRFRLADPLSATRKGFLLSMGGSRGKKLFTGVHLVANYFFDAIQAFYSGSLTYPGIEIPDDLQAIPNLSAVISEAGDGLMSSLLERQRVLVLGKRDDIRSQIAGALIQYHAGNRFHVRTGGDDPAQAVHPDVVSAMAEVGIDLAFRRPGSRSQALQDYHPDHIIAMDAHIDLPTDCEAKTWIWNLPDPQAAAQVSKQELREQIHKNVDEFVKSQSTD